MLESRRPASLPPLFVLVAPLFVGVGLVADLARAQEQPAVARGVEETWNKKPTGPVTLDDGRGGRPLPSLDEVVAKALTMAPDVRSGQAAVEVSRSSRVNAGRPPLDNPYFEVFAQQAVNSNVTQGLPFTATVWLPIEVAGNRGRRIKEAEAFVGMYEAGLDLTEVKVAGQAVAAYGRVVVAAERVRVLERLLAVSREAVNIYESRMEAGDAILRDVTMARMDLGRTHALLAEARGRFASSMADLLLLTGERYDRVETSSIAPPPIDPDAFVDRARDEEALPAVAAVEAQGRYYDEQKVRLKRDAVNPFQLMLMGGKGDFGEARVGAGIAYAIPAFRSRQGERAFAEAESHRAEIEGDIRAARIRARVQGIVDQYEREREALEVLTDVALPAADEAVEAAVATAAGGKEDAFVVIFSRRERVLLTLQRLEALERQWSLLGELVGLTGEMP